MTEKKVTQASLVGCLMMTAELANCFATFCKERAGAMEPGSPEAELCSKYSVRAAKLADGINRAAQAHVSAEKAAGAGAAEPLESDSTHELVSKAVSEVLGILGDKIVPDNVHGVVPMGGVQAVPRYGAAAVGAGGDRPSVSAEFQNLVRLD